MRQLTTVTFARRDRPITVTAETTSCPQLVIAPGLEAAVDGDEGFGYSYVVVHAPTGRTVPAGFHAYDLHSTRRFAEAIATLDWDFTDPGHLATEAGESLRNAVRDAQRAIGEVTPRDDEEHDEGPDDQLPKTAAAAVPQAVRHAQALWTQWWRGDEKVTKAPMEDADGKPNPLYFARMFAALNAFDRAYLLGCLAAVDPQAADSAACWLGQQHEAGDTVGEWLWEWKEAVENGQPVRFPGAMPVVDPATVALTEA